MIIKEQFFDTVAEYSNNEDAAAQLWKELEKAYSAKTRHYHTLEHLDDMLTHLLPFKDKFQDWHAVVFAVAYHDAIYHALRGNNEEKSASLAAKRLTGIGVPDDRVRKVEQLILATKKHEAVDYDTNLFADADLSILGSGPDTYSRYLKNIRQEYAVYPDLVYKPGRKKVLLHFLNMPRIFKTEEFFVPLEEKARKNLQEELRILSG